jgi:glucuronate isomerase
MSSSQDHSTEVGNRLSNALFPADPATRELTCHLYSLVKDLPIISPHGHVDSQLLLANKPFGNPAELFIYFDHYVTRLLHAEGFSLEQLGKGDTTEESAKKAWNILCSNWHLFAGTASGYWFTHSFATLFGITETPSTENAAELYEIIDQKLKTNEFLPRELFKSFNIEFLATTDDPTDDLAAHKSLAEDSSFSGRVVPTFRPDKYLDINHPEWIKSVTSLTSLTGDALTYKGFISSLENRRQYFINHGTISADHGVRTPYTTILSDEDASAIFSAALNGKATPDQIRDFGGHMLIEMARMSVEDGLVMTLHAGVHRNHNTATFKKYGPDTGQDVPLQVEFVENLHPLLEKYGLHSNLHLILFSLDETSWSRDVAPLAGFYPSVYIGVPWWFLDTPDGIRRFREATTDIAGFYRGSGFIDDTRAFLSIPARHDSARRVDSAYLARLVLEGRISLAEAEKIAVDLVVAVPKRAFKL